MWGQSKRSSLGHTAGDSASTGGARGPGFTKASLSQCVYQDAGSLRLPGGAARPQPQTCSPGSARHRRGRVPTPASLAQGTEPLQQPPNGAVGAQPLPLHAGK